MIKLRQPTLDAADRLFRAHSPTRRANESLRVRTGGSCIGAALLALALLTSVLAGCAGLTPAPAAPSLPAQSAPAALDPAALPARPARFESVSVAQGLSESVVHAILQDSQGFLWFGTDDGLNRYDGISIHIYRNDSADSRSLAHNSIRALQEDRTGRIWVGLSNAGINRLEPGTGEFTRYRFSGELAQKGANQVKTLLIDGAGTLWAGTAGAGLLRYNEDKDEFQSFLIQSEGEDLDMFNAVYTLLEDAAGTLWVGTAKGLYTFDRAAAVFTPVLPAADAKDFPAAAVTALRQDRAGMLWVGMEKNGLLRLDPAARQPVIYTLPAYDEQAGVSSILFDQVGVLWVGTYGGGLCRLADPAAADPAKAPFECFQNRVSQPDSVGSNSVTALLEDRSGVLWIGTYGAGANKLPPAYKPFITLRNDPENLTSLASDMVFALFFDGPDVLWAGTIDQGLERIDLPSGKVTHYRSQASDPDSLSDNFVRAIYRDSRGRLWVGTQNGLNRLDEQSGRFIRYLPGEVKNESADSGEEQDSIPGERVSAIAEAPDGTLWLGLDRVGLAHFDPQQGSFALYKHYPDNPNSLSDSALYDLTVDPDGVVWIGTVRRGLERFDPRSRVFTHFPHDPANAASISDPTVLWVRRDSAGTLWAATPSGLNRLNPRTGGFDVYRTREGLPNDFVYTFLEDEQGGLWLSTNKGIARLDPATGAVKAYDVHDGLQSDEFNSGAAARAPDGRMAFAGIHGITLFYPAQVRDNPYVPPVALTSVSQHGSPLHRQPGEVERVLLRWPDNYFDFEFAALNYIRPEKNQYAYILENFDREWNLTGGRRDGRYTNLPGGTYTLRVVGSNNDGVWNQTGVALVVQVIPPVWQTWWFQGGLGLLVLALVGLVMRLRLRGMETRTRELERLVRARTAEIERLFEQNKELAVVEERSRLARDLHDSAKQRAFAALAQIGAVGGLLKSDPRKASAALAEAETLVYEVIEELTFLIQEMYPAALKEKGLAATLREYLYEWEARNDIRVDFQAENPRRVPLNVEQAIYRVTQEALANVARHSQARAVEVALGYYAGQVTVRIHDDGKGFDPQTRPAGIGLRSMRERVNMIGGTLNIESRPGQGTMLFAWAPLGPLNGGAPPHEEKIPAENLSAPEAPAEVETLTRPANVEERSEP
jgi:signal transduction histidine kinase/ligand-binding sensor domain-containing protein